MELVKKRIYSKYIRLFLPEINLTRLTIGIVGGDSVQLLAASIRSSIGTVASLPSPVMLL
jgi:hypothetical protein